jgi:hypothetical protein
MNKSEQREVTKARNIAKIDPNMAANMLACLHRAALTARSQREILAVMDEECLTQYCEERNGCYVLRVQ